MSVGSHSITAVYNGDGNFLTSTSGPLSQSVNKAATTTAVISSVNPSIFNQPVTFTATVTVNPPGSASPTAPTGTVTFTDTTTATTLGTATINASGVATLTTSALPVNAQAIQAAYSGDGNFLGGSGTMTQTVTYLTGGQCDGSPGHQILPPINPDGSSVFKYGSTVPVKFRICDFLGNSIGTPGVVTSFTVIGYVSGTVSSVNETIDSTNPDTAFRWDPTGQQWIFNLATSGLAKNATAVFTIRLNDGTIVGPASGGVNLAPGSSSFQFGLK